MNSLKATKELNLISNLTFTSLIYLKIELLENRTYSCIRWNVIFKRLFQDRIFDILSNNSIKLLMDWTIFRTLF